MLPTFDFLVKIDEIYVTSRHFGEMPGTLLAKMIRHATMGDMRQNFDSGSGALDIGAFIQCIDGR